MEGERSKNLDTWRSMREGGRENSSIMQRGMAPPHGFDPAGFRSKRNVVMLALARDSAAEAPDGPPPMTAARSGLEEAVMMRWRWRWRWRL